MKEKAGVTDAVPVENEGSSNTPYDDAFRTMMGKSGVLRVALVNELYNDGSLAFDKYLLLTDMIKKVADSLSVRYDNARKELDDIMGGKILEFKGERIYNEGREEGREEGRTEGKIDELLGLAYDGTLPVDVAASRALSKYKVPKDEFMRKLKSYKSDDELMQG